MTGVDGGLTDGVSWPNSAISASTCCMLWRSASSGLGMPGVTTVVGTGFTVAHPVSSPRTRSAAGTESHISGLATRATRRRTHKEGSDGPRAAHVRRGPVETERGRRHCGRLAQGAYAPMCGPLAILRGVRMGTTTAAPSCKVRCAISASIMGAGYGRGLRMGRM